MGKVIVYGVSDDLIEVDGDVGYEFGIYGDDVNFVGVSNGTLFEISYGGNGEWNIFKHYGEAEIYHAGSEKAKELNEFSGEYSDVAVVRSKKEINWIIRSDAC